VPNENKTLTKLELPHHSPIGRITKNHLIRPILNRFGWLRVKHLFQDDLGFYYIQAKALTRPYIRLNPRSINKYIRVEDCPYKTQLIKKDIFIHIYDLASY